MNSGTQPLTRRDIYTALKAILRSGYEDNYSYQDALEKDGWGQLKTLVSRLERELWWDECKPEGTRG